RKTPAEFVDPRHDQFPVCPVLQPRILADFLVILMPCEVHAQDRVVVIRTRKLGRRVGYQHLDEFVDVHAAGANHLHSHSFRDITWLYRILFGHSEGSSKHKASADRPSSKGFVMHSRPKRDTNLSQDVSVRTTCPAQRFRRTPMSVRS